MAVILDQQGPHVASESPTRSFNTICPTSFPQRPNYPAPSDEAIDVAESTMLHWAAAPNASAYEVYLGTTQSPPCFSRTTGTSIETPKNLRRGGRYYWRVIARNDTGTAASRIWTFEVVANPDGPTVPRGIYPPDQSTMISNDLRLDWLDSAAANRYEIYLDTNPAPATLIATTDAATSELRPPALAFGTTYYWRVAADATAWLPAVSGDGRYVSFSSWASNLNGSTGGNFEIFRKDLQTGAIVQLSDATTSPRLGSYSALSGRGGVAAIRHDGDLVAGASNPGSDMFVTGCAP